MAGLPVGQQRAVGRFSAGARCSSLLERFRPALGCILSPEPCFLGTGCLSSTEKRLNREASHLSPSSTEFKNEWSYTSKSPYAFMASTGTNLVYHRLNLLTAFYSALLVKAHLIIFSYKISFFKKCFQNSVFGQSC